ncbi:MAG: cytochrome c maturation protein CcmE [Deinococcota bacterium]
MADSPQPNSTPADSIRYPVTALDSGRNRVSKKIAYGLAGIGVLIVAGLFIYQALNTSLVYFILPSEHASNPSQYVNRRIRLGGIVEKDSVSFDDEQLLLNFYITDSIDRYAVSHYGTPPELFQENTGVVVEGGFENGVFVSDNLLVKHSEVYEAAPDGTVDLDMLRESLE